MIAVTIFTIIRINLQYNINESAITANIPITDRETSRRFSAATFNAIAYVTERLMETGYPLIIEGNFVMSGQLKANEGEIIRNLIEKYGYESLTFILWGDTRILCDRYNEREKSPEWKRLNLRTTELTYDDCEKWFPPLGEGIAAFQISDYKTRNEYYGIP
jgi:hypothetical protein